MMHAAHRALLVMHIPVELNGNSVSVILCVPMLSETRPFAIDMFQIPIRIAHPTYAVSCARDQFMLWIRITAHYQLSVSPSISYPLTHGISLRPSFYLLSLWSILCRYRSELYQPITKQKKNWFQHLIKHHSATQCMSQYTIQTCVWLNRIGTSLAYAINLFAFIDIAHEVLSCINK